MKYLLDKIFTTGRKWFGAIKKNSLILYDLYDDMPFFYALQYAGLFY